MTNEPLNLNTVEGRIRDCVSYNFGMRSADMLAHEDAPAMLARLREVEALNHAARALHHPVEALNTRYGRRQQVCAGCGTDDGNWMVWPCPTTRALTKAEGSTGR